MIFFPGTAGDLQRAGELAALRRELAGRYDYYHEFLLNQQRDLGDIVPARSFSGRPADAASFTEYIERVAARQELLSAEHSLRTADAATRLGRVPGTPEFARDVVALHGVPLATRTGRLEEKEASDARVRTPPPAGSSSASSLPEHIRRRHES